MKSNILPLFTKIFKNNFILFQTWFHAEIRLFQTQATAVGRPS